MRVGLLQCDHVPAGYRSIDGDYDEMFASMFRGRDVELVTFDVPEGRLPLDASDCDAYLISGSRASVYQDGEWIRDLEGFVRTSVEASVPIFGICFGLQVMAVALGGVVERSKRGWGVGVHTMHVVGQRPWMRPETNTLALIMSHEDQIVRLPDGAAVLGSSEHCPNYLVEFAPGCVGIQGHPEMSALFAEAIYNDRRAEMGILSDRAVESLRSSTDVTVAVEWILEVFGGDGNSP
ncbi:MAG: gamma-glutamyl-gamma-aminobutyrate hydrolase family protein [Actinomycetota bacterium]|nr:gamma-glutamyl-gamma-aminobutyrate hydrolase family protein [Actinomycetota bacterium]